MNYISSISSKFLILGIFVPFWRKNIQTYVLMLGLVVLIPARGWGQNSAAELNQRMQAFVSTMDSTHEVKRFNLAPRDIGGVHETELVDQQYFQLRSRDKMPNSFGRNTKQRVYIHAFAFESAYILENALQYWFSSFVNAQQIRPGRLMRSYDGGRPLYIIASSTYIVIVDLDCAQYHEEQWKELKKTMDSFFDEEKTGMALELLCDGPLTWVRNAPDLRKK